MENNPNYSTTIKSMPGESGRPDGLPDSPKRGLTLAALDYLFGFEPKKNKPFRFDPDLGYDNFKLFTRTPNGTVILNTFDLEVGGREKALSNGGGYCGFLNTVLALTLAEYLTEYG